jgi:hypothetical protein
MDVGGGKNQGMELGREQTVIQRPSWAALHPKEK